MNNQLTKRRAHFFAAAAFSVLFMLLFAFLMPGMKASAANPPTYNYKPSCVGGKYYFTISEADYSKTTYSNTYVCSSRDGNYFVIKPNTGTSGRYCRVTVRNRYGVALAYIDINQLGVPTYTPSRIACTGGSVTSPASGADYTKTEYSYKAVCNSISGGKFIINANSTTSERECKITVKNSAGRVIYYIYIKQAAVKLTPKSIAGGGSSFGCQYQTTVSLTPTVANTIDVTASAPSGGWYNYTVNVSTNPSTTASRPFDINVKNSSGKLVEIIRVTQEKYTIPTPSKDINFTAQPVSYTFAGAVAKVEYTKPSMILSRTKTGNTYTFNVTQNPDPYSRSSKVTFKDKYGTVLATYTVNQGHAHIYEREVDEGCPTLEFYNKSGVATFEFDEQYVNRVTPIGSYQYYIIITANKSTTKSRTFYITAKNSSGVIVEFIKITQAPHEHYYEYAVKNDMPTRKCLYCNDRDDCFTFTDYLSKFGKANNEQSVKDYMQLYKYAENSKATQDMLAAYRYINKTENKSILQKIYNKLQDKYMNMYSTASDVAIFAQNDKLDKSLSIISAANHAFMFLTAGDNTAVKFSAAVKFAGDISGIALNDYGYLSNALDTVGDALNDTIPLIRKEQDTRLKDGLIDYDSTNGDYIARTSKSTLNWTTVYNAIRVRCIDKKGRCLFTEEELVEATDKVFKWKAAYEAQIALNQLYTNLGYKVTVSTDGGFWKFVENYIK